jgi:hypothetical protein
LGQNAQGHWIGTSVTMPLPEEHATAIPIKLATSVCLPSPRCIYGSTVTMTLA